MARYFNSIPLVLILALLTACTSSQRTATPLPITPASLPITPTTDPFFASNGAGEPRSAGYWLLWNSCAPDNNAEVASANGGRAAGWIILDDLLEDPGILMGGLQVQTCLEGIYLLQGLDILGADRPGDAAYSLAAQLLAAQLNLAAGAESCPAADKAVASAQLLLISAGFDGKEEALGAQASPGDLEMAGFLNEQLGQYNSGLLCR